MNYDSLILAAVTDELERLLTGGKIDKITQPTPLEVVLRVFTNNGKHDVLLCADADFARAHLTWIKRENPPQPYSFCTVLRRHIDGARIAGFDRPGGFGERVLVIRLKSFDGAPSSLIVEIMGRHSNIILINGPGMILGAAKHISSDINRYREILPGRTYQPPPRQRDKIDPFAEFDGDSSTSISADDAATWLIQTFTGVSPLLAREAVARSTQPLLTQQSTWVGLADALGAVRTGNYSPIVWSDDAGKTLGAYPIPLQSVKASNQYERQSISVALDNATSSIGKRSAFEAARDTLTSALHRAGKHRRHEIDEVARGLANADRADEYTQSGDLLQSNQHAYARGETSITVPDYYADVDGAERTITLDPTLGCRENAERYYKKAAKARGSRAMLEQRQSTLHEELRLLDRAEADLPTASTEDEIEQIHERVANLLLRGSQRPSTEGGAAPPEASRFEGFKIRTFRSVDGWEILVGENATSNDYLTTKVASPSDIWLHVRAATSAHGIIRAQNRPASVSTAAIRHAAELVAARSEVKHSSLIPVDYTLKKYVRKPRKSAPGSVTYQNEKTMYVGGINDRE